MLNYFYGRTNTFFLGALACFNISTVGSPAHSKPIVNFRPGALEFQKKYQQK